MCANVSVLPRILLLSGVALLLPVQSRQQSLPAAQPATAFKATARTVIVDVVVDDGGKPVRGLKKEDFNLFEDGNPQTIAFFEPHFEDATHSDAILRAPLLPENTYSNMPVSHVADSVTVLLLDSLNTYTEDQLYVRRQMIQYLKTLPPGRRIAIFTLGSHLRLLQGFGSDATPLLAALNSKQSNPQATLRAQKDDAFKDREVLDMLASGGATTETLDAYKDFMATSKAFQTDMRVDLTLEALQEMARYLSGIPGRKNLIWFSGSFPINLFPAEKEPGHNNREVSRNYTEKVHATASLLAAARVAVYPVDVRGVLLAPMFTAAEKTDYGGNPKRFRADNKAFELEAGGEHNTMDQMAKDTGGRAVYESNGLKEAMERALDDGSNFYTLAYTPANQKFDGALRKIEVKIADGKYQLSYRRDYFADEDNAKQGPASQGPNSVFVAAIRRGVPTATQIVFDVRVVAAGPQPPPGPIAGENAALKGPVTRYAIDYAADLRAIELRITPKGFHEGQVLMVTAAYDSDGKLLNAVSTTQPIAIGPEAYAQFRQNGLQLHQLIDLPKGHVYLRAGICDPASGRIGTLEIPLTVATQVSNSASATR